MKLEEIRAWTAFFFITFDIHSVESPYMLSAKSFL